VCLSCSLGLLEHPLLKRPAELACGWGWGLQAIKNPQAAGVAKKGKKMSLKNRKQAEKRAQTKNYGRGKK
jgi:hypothetical protein